MQGRPFGVSGPSTSGQTTVPKLAPMPGYQTGTIDKKDPAALAASVPPADQYKKPPQGEDNKKPGEIDFKAFGIDPNKSKEEYIQDSVKILEDVLGKREDIKGDRGYNLAMLGLRIAAGQDPSAFANIVKGAEQTLGEYGEAKRREREEERQIALAAADMGLKEFGQVKDLQRGLLVKELELQMPSDEAKQVAELMSMGLTKNEAIDRVFDTKGKPLAQVEMRGTLMAQGFSPFFSNMFSKDAQKMQELGEPISTNSDLPKAYSIIKGGRDKLNLRDIEFILPFIDQSGRDAIIEIEPKFFINLELRKKELEKLEKKKPT